MTDTTPMFDMIDRSAQISADGKYRYRLTRRWAPGVLMPFCMLNPSTADAEVDDPTIRRCIAFAKREGSAGITVVNLFAFRATKPSVMLAADDPVGPDNSGHIADVAATARHLVCAWGATSHPIVLAMGNAVRTAATDNGIALFCLGTTGSGQPRHPLYVPGSQPLSRLGGVR